MAARTLAGSAAGAAATGWLGAGTPRPPDGPPVKTVTAARLSGSCAAPTAFSEAVSPTAKVAATVPKTTASSMATVRTGCAKGVARPYVTARGSGSRPAARWAHWPRPVRGARPTAMASTVRSRPARSAGTSAAIPTTSSAAVGTRRSTHQATDSEAAPYASSVSATSGTASRLLSTTPRVMPTPAGSSAWAT